MIVASEVLENFSTLSNISGEALIKCFPLCEECLSETLSMIKPNINQDTYKSSIIHLASVLAYYRYASQNYINMGGASLKVGDVSVSENNNSLSPEEAHKLYLQTLESLSNIISDSNFWFGSVAI